MEQQRTKEFLELRGNDINRIPVCIDFDGTVVTHMFPYVGDDVPGAEDWLRRLVEKYNVGLILDTMRSGKHLADAVKWFEDRNIPLMGISKHPTQHTWTNSPKAYGEYSIDDRNVGTPLVYDPISGRMAVDWEKVGPMLVERINRVGGAKHT